MPVAVKEDGESKESAEVAHSYQQIKRWQIGKAQQTDTQSGILREKQAIQCCLNQKLRIGARRTQPRTLAHQRRNL